MAAAHMMPADCVPGSRGGISCMFGGWWFSTPTAGECAAGAKLGTNGCTWRTIAQPKTVNDTGCMALRMVAPLLAHNPTCFKALPVRPSLAT